MTADQLLGTTAADVVAEFFRRGETGVRLVEVTPFDADAFLRRLKIAVGDARVVWAGLTIAQTTALSRSARFPAARLTGDLEVGTQWRNDPRSADPIVVVSFEELEKLGTFHRFASIKDHHLYSTLCTFAETQFCPNQALASWWVVLKRRETMRQISVRRLANYCIFLGENAGRLPEATREGLYLLGLLPARSFFDHASDSELRRRFQINRGLASRIELLSNPDRNRLSQGLSSANGKVKERLEETIARVLKYNRTGSDQDRKLVWEEDVRDLLEAKRVTAKSTKRVRQTVPSETMAADALLAGRDDELKELSQKLKDAIDSLHDDPTTRIGLEIEGRGDQGVANVDSGLLDLLERAIGMDLLGGVYRLPAADTMQAALSELNKGSFLGFSTSGRDSIEEKIRLIVANGLVEAELAETWTKFLDHRNKLVPHRATLSVSPLVVLASDEELLVAGEAYLDTYERLLSIVRDRYESLAAKSPKGFRTLAAKLMLMDIVVLEAAGNVKAVLSPLHPIHLWKLVRLARQLKRDRNTIDSDDREVLSEYSRHLPHFLTAVYVPEGLVLDRAFLLPESGQLQTLPYYETGDLHYSGVEGQDRLIRVIQKFLALYRHAKAHLRLCLIDPPSAGDLLEALASAIINGEVQVSSVSVTIYRTLDRAVTLGQDEQQLEAIAEVFADGGQRRFGIQIIHERIGYADVVRQLCRSPVHVIAAFDPSTTRVGQVVAGGNGFVHPLVLPKEFQYDPIEDDVRVIPAATGDLFDLYHTIQSRLNNALTGSQFGISTTFGLDANILRGLLDVCTWLVVGDRLLDTHPIKDGFIISYDPGQHRDLIVLATDFLKFEKEFDYQLRKANLDPTPEAIHDLIASSCDLLGEGLLNLVRLSEEDEDVL